MEKRLNTRIETYVTTFKDDVRKKIIELGFEEKMKMNELIEYIYEYERLTLTKDDFVKRKRVKNAIPVSNRCHALRANGEQCTRQRKDNCEFCGTHSKGVPHGLLSQNGVQAPPITQKLEVIAEEIKGIVYYVDQFQNVYRTQDILAGKQNPEIIAKYEKNNQGNYSIPSLGI
jgi:hypothetical protein